MEDELSRRDFLKCSMAAGALLMAGDTIVGGSMSHAKALMAEVDKLAVWVLTDNYYDALRPDNKITKRYRVVPGKSIHAEHGLSYFVETTIEGKTSACMFDYGLDPVGVMNNMSLLGVDVARVNAFTLSHGHYDHYMAAVEMLKQNQTRVRKGAPFYVGEEAFYHRFSLRPGTTKAADLGQLKKEEIESLGRLPSDQCQTRNYPENSRRYQVGQTGLRGAHALHRV